MSEQESPFDSGRYRYTRIDGRGASGEEPSEPGPGADGSDPSGSDNTPGRSRGRGVDRAIGIALGLILGIAIIVAFVFLGGEETIDAPGIEAPEQVRESIDGGRDSGGSGGATEGGPGPATGAESGR